MAIIDDIKGGFLRSSMLMRLIFINVIVFVLVRLVLVGTYLLQMPDGDVLGWVAMSSDLLTLAHRPWTVVTYMFTHYDVLHILLNMLWLYWLGRIFMEFFSAKQLSGVYILGGLGGAALFLAVYHLLPHSAATQSYLLGASASVIAIVVATAVYTPDYKIGLLFLGDVSLKWIAIVTVAIDLLSLNGGNAGGSIAHLGGAIIGWLYAWRIRHGRDITRPLNAAIDGIVGLFNGRKLKFPRFGNPIIKRAESTGSTRDNRPADIVSEDELDKILDKIRASGYDALSDEEREKLFKASRRRSP